VIRKLSDRCLVVTNKKIHGLYGKTLEESLKKNGVNYKIVRLPDGEKNKNLVSVGKIHDKLISERFDRDAVVAGFGGGIIGDMAGFAAATYMRGCQLVQIPTTLLAQVDSSVGGKTGVNHRMGKNLIGAFYQPSAVLADIQTLKSLPVPETLCGVAEVIKYGLIASNRLFCWLEGNIKGLIDLKGPQTIHAVSASCRIKASVVSEDEKEANKRAILNFGHTTGHAIEAVTEYNKHRHGYAVAMGMSVALELSRMKEGLTDKAVSRAKDLIAYSGLPTAIPKKISELDLIKAMRYDKKVRSGLIRFALLEGIGKCTINTKVTTRDIKEALRLSKCD
tara:strand:+ start:72413 stop:73417 length:1005 start_codon:yes stop_codon:yes gene_type:complete